ncbi:MAG TPA: hypothetical protein VE955_02215, partial [Candidatus Dormibacteraeota bacterium]|nr:hypothetical protein [Candidatus Dormibacteraeota bacterium]
LLFTPKLIDCAADFWTSFSFPLWFTNPLSSLDSLPQIRFDTSQDQVRGGMEWFLSRQKRSGLWTLKLRIMARETEPNHRITLAICRVLKRSYD